MRESIDDAEQDSAGQRSAADLALYGMLRYHLGWADESFQPASFDAGKRMRPLVALLTCGAVGGDPRAAVPVAAAIELLHNFTLIHDDIQDRSDQRRGRPTVWRTWGESQAINAGDAMFAVSQLSLARSPAYGTAVDRLPGLLVEFNRAALRIVEGQVLDLDFEQRWDIRVADYIRMVSGKSAAIVGFACWAGGWSAGLGESACRKLTDFGVTLGLGFQIRDDYLGVWGSEAETGKVQADDIRRRKRAIPLVLALEKLPEHDRVWLQRMFDVPGDIDEADVQRVVGLMSEHLIDVDVLRMAEEYHDHAGALLPELMLENPYRQELERLLESLAVRTR